MNAIVTGATKGMGLAITERLANEGFNLVICSRNKVELLELAESIQQKFKVKVKWMEADLSNKTEVLTFAKFALDQFNDIDILVNNTGIFISRSILDEEDGDLEKQMNINLFAPYHLTRAVGNLMKKNNKG